jgi:hypothetical protein
MSTMMGPQRNDIDRCFDLLLGLLQEFAKKPPV